MSQILSIMKWEFLNRMKSKVFIITMILFPILIIAMSIIPSLLIMQDGMEVYRVGIVDETKSINDILMQKLSTDYKLENGESKFVPFVFDFVKDAKISTAKNEIDGFIVLPDSIILGKDAEYYATSLSNFKILDELRRAVNHSVIEVRVQQENLEIEVVNKLTKWVGLNTFEISESGEASEGNELVSFFIPFATMFLLFMSIFVNGQLLLRSVMEERTSRVIEVILSSVTPRQLMFGKILGLGALGLVQLLVYLAIGFGALYFRGMGQTIEIEHAFWMILFFFLGYFFYAAIFGTMGTLFDSEQEAQQSTSIITIIVVIPMMMSSYFITNPGSMVTKVMSFFPPFTPFMIPLRFGTGIIELWEAVLAAVLLGLSVWGMMILAGKIFRVTLLMYGKRITLPEIIRWIKT